jgi:hypothetical protein
MATKISAVVLIIGAFLAGTALVAKPVTEGADGSLTYYKDVLPIVQKNCQGCHRPGQIGPFSLMSYKETRPWAKAIKNAVAARKMPPWFANPQYGHFDNERSLTQAEIDKITAWVDAGAIEGDAKDAPAPAQWPEGGWMIKPDVVVELPPYQVPAKGIKEWEHFAVPSPFKEDTWVTSVEILPSAPAVAHHLCFDIARHDPKTPYNLYEWMEVPRDEDGVMKARDGNTQPREGIVVTRAVGSTEEKRRPGRAVIGGGNQFCYLPGLPFEDYRPANAGVFVPKGSDILLNLHYTANGVATTDNLRIGFTVAKTPPQKKYVPQFGAEDDAAPTERQQANAQLAIPPGADNYPGPPATISFLRDTELVWFRPHAHVRGKSVQYKLIYPDGKEQIVLDVPHYDFNWQLTYRTSVKIPKGSKMIVQFRYDNSPNNKYNPDPTKWVYYGGQSWEEMGTPNMGFIMDRETNEKDFVKEQ